MSKRLLRGQKKPLALSRGFWTRRRGRLRLAGRVLRHVQVTIRCLKITVADIAHTGNGAVTTADQHRLALCPRLGESYLAFVAVEDVPFLWEPTEEPLSSLAGLELALVSLLSDMLPKPTEPVCFCDRINDDEKF